MSKNSYLNLKRKLFHRIEDLCVNPNGSKYLSSSPKEYEWCNKRQQDIHRKISSARKFSIYMRDRSRERYYYLVTLKGNYIRGYKIGYTIDGKNVNTYMSIAIPAILGGETAVPIVRKTLIAKQLFRNWLEFVLEFKTNSPSLEWDDDEFFNVRLNKYAGPKRDNE